MKKIQRLSITFEIFTKASEPLELDISEKEALIEGLEQAVKSHVNLRYFPDGNRHLEDRHELIGVHIAEASA